MIKLRQEDVTWTEGRAWTHGRITAPDGRVMTHCVGSRALVTANLEADLNYYMDRLEAAKRDSFGAV